MLEEVELLVGCRGPEVLAGIGDSLPAERIGSIEYGAALFLAVGRIGYDQVVAIAGIGYPGI